MVEQVTPTLEPQSSTPEALVAPAVPSHAPTADTRNDFLFDSIAQEGIESDDEPSGPWTRAITATLWIGYGIAVVVALVLVWSAAKELLQ